MQDYTITYKKGGYWELRIDGIFAGNFDSYKEAKAELNSD